MFKRKLIFLKINFPVKSTKTMIESSLKEKEISALRKEAEKFWFL